MTRRQAREVLDHSGREIALSCQRRMDGIISQEQLVSTVIFHHDAIRDAGQTDNFLRRWRATSGTFIHHTREV